MQDPIILSRRAWLSACMAAGAVAAGCGGDAESPEDFLNELVEPVADVGHTEVRRQSIGNCWAYASTGWLEALHKARTDTSVNVSESWITFWDWHRKITGQATGGITRNATTMRDEVSTGGWWDTAMTILRDRGVVFEEEFIPEEAMSERSSRQSEALAAINNELNGEEGRLVSATARRDPQIVLNVLLDAWRINDEIRAEIRRVFGISARTRISSVSQPPAWMRKATAFQIRTSVRRSSGTVSRFDGYLSDVIPGGRYAWRSASYPSSATSRIALQRRVMGALNAAQPVIVSWLVDFNARLPSTGAFDLETLRAAGPGRQGGHLVVSEDYQVVIREPGMPERTLPAGELASEADMRLAERYGELAFLRIKNSWGTAQGPLGGGFGGYHDLMANYLNGPIRWTATESDRVPLSSVILPSGF